MAETVPGKHIRMLEPLIRMWLVLLAFVIFLGSAYVGMSHGKIVVLLATPVTYGVVGETTYRTASWTDTLYRNVTVRLSGNDSRILELLLDEPAISEGEVIPVRVVGREGIRYASFSELYEIPRILYLLTFVLPPIILTWWALKRYEGKLHNLDWMWLRVLTFAVSLPLSLLLACSVIDKEWETPTALLATIVMLAFGIRWLFFRTREPVTS